MINFEVDVELIRRQAKQAYPHEGVWLVTEQGGTYQVDNIHEQPADFFMVSAADSLQAMREGLKAVVHSHCDGYPVPSAEDMTLFDRLRVPCGILETDGTNCTEINWMVNEIQPLEGRPFSHGTADCYSIVRDYYRLAGVEIADVPRNWLWWESGENLLDELFESRGFFEVPANQAKEGDVWFAQVRGPVIHHCGILLDNDLILHHPGSGDPVDRTKLSIKEPMFRYMPYFKKFLRHKDFV